MKDLKTPLRYPGGKSRAVDFLFSRENLPVKNIKEYREPFLGGGSCAFAFTKKFPDIPVRVNDKYYNLYCFWLTLQKEGDALTQKLHDIKDELLSASDPKQAHYDYYHVVTDVLANPKNEFETAWAFYILNRCSFSGLTELSASFSKGSCFDHFHHRLIGKLPKYSRLMQNWTITNEDYSTMFCDDPDVFVFCDPPYDIATFIYGKGGDMHNTFDHKDFFECTDASGNMVMITYNSNDTLQEAYKNWNQKIWDLVYTMVSSASYRENEHLKKELLIWNYETPEIIPEQTLEEFFV